MKSMKTKTAYVLSNGSTLWQGEGKEAAWGGWPRFSRRVWRNLRLCVTLAALAIALTVSAAEAQTVVALTSDNPAVVVPPSVVIPVGATTMNFPISVGTVVVDQAVVITATAGGATATITLQLVAARKPTSLTCAPTTLGEGQTGACSVTLNLPAVAATPVIVASSSPALHAPAAVTVAGGSQTAAFGVLASGVLRNENATIMVMLGGTAEGAKIRLRKP